jgi:arabinan endo-1,5-alpha-L-arabinosidase
VSSLELKDIHIRDPFILSTGDRYYLYGTRGPTVWTEADGFDCYTSDDLASWSGPFEIFRKSDDFWADRCYWAPECYFYDGAYYLLATFGSADGRLGVQILSADSPLGPFGLHSDGPVTPWDQQCLDGTLYLDEGGTPQLVFSRSFRQAGEGHMCVVKLAPDLRTAVGEAGVLFQAVDAPWARPFPFAKEFGIAGDVYLSDGPFVYKTQSGQLLLLWSSFGSSGYSVGIARSATGDILGPWTHEARPLVDGEGGHGMVFESKEGKRLLAIHGPNAPGQERPILVELAETDDGLAVQRGDH